MLYLKPVKDRVSCTGAEGITDKLRQVEVPTMANPDCDALYGFVGAGVVCTDSTGGKGTCHVRSLTQCYTVSWV